MVQYVPYVVWISNEVLGYVNPRMSNLGGEILILQYGDNFDLESFIRNIKIILAKQVNSEPLFRTS